MRNVFLQKSCRKCSRRLVPHLFLCLKKLNKLKASNQQLNFNIFWQTSVQTYKKINFITFQAVELKICSISIFYKRFQEKLFYHILCIIFQEIFFLSYVLLTTHISMPGCLQLLRYSPIYILSFFIVQSGTSKILKLTLAFLSSRFST